MTTPRRHRGFTLVELVVSLAIASIVLLGATGVIALASKALPTDDEPASMMRNFAATAEAINADASVALQIEPSRLAMVLPDADDDGRVEVVEYAIDSGRLTRAYNRGEPVTLMRNVTRLVMTGEAVGGVVVLTTDIDSAFGDTYSTSAITLNLETAP